MLKSINLANKTYEEMMAEAITQIPLHTAEWTNFNVSDPGMTILQNLTSFNLLQQTRINEVTEAVQRQLLRLVGFEAVETAPSRVLVEALVERRERIPAQKKLMAGELCFEFDRETHLTPWGIHTVYTEEAGAFKDITYLLSREVPTETPVFGAPAQAGRALYCMLDGLPEQGPLRLWIKVAAGEHRNPFGPEQNLSFARSRWQVFTREGWLDAAAADNTHGFLVDGEITLTLPDCPPEVFDQVDRPGYALRCILEEEAYDLAPRLRSITANLVELTQRDTLSRIYRFDGEGPCELFAEMADYDCMFVYAREEEDGPYREYKCYTGVFETGRLYRQEFLADGTVRILFDKERFGDGPAQSRDAVCVVCCSETMVHHRSLGQLFGYDDQLIELDHVENVLPDDFSLIYRTREASGEYAFRFVPPCSQRSGDPYYKVLSREGSVMVSRPGEGDDCFLLLGDLAVTAGGEGNIREENLFLPAGQSWEGIRLKNPAPGRGGRTSETVEELRKRFVAAIAAPTTAVTAADHERIVMETPGLCVHKVKAVVDPDRNTVKIAVKPYGEESLPALSPIYLRQIARHHEARRMITNRVEILQPHYVAVDVKATIYVKSYYENARREIEDLLRRELDFVSSDQGFGGTVYTDEVYRRLEALPCVESIYELLLAPRSRSGAVMAGGDILLAEHCLCYPGKLLLELQNSR